MFADGSRDAGTLARVPILIRARGGTWTTRVAPIWEKVHDEGLTGMTALGRHLLEIGSLRDGSELDEVRDVLSNCSPSTTTTSAC